MKTLVVVNPHSSNRSTGRKWPRIRKALEDTLGTFEEKFTEGTGHATDLVRSGLAAGAERIISVGGDGTNNEVVNGFFDAGRPVSPDACLGFIPRGTGGDLRKTLGIGRDLDECLPVLSAGKTLLSDVGRVTFVDHSGAQVLRMFINITSFGIGGLVDKKVNESSKALGGKLAFAIGTIKAMMQYRNKRLHLKVTDATGKPVHDQEVVVNFVAVANGQYFGGGMWVAPNARIDDGLFDVIIHGDMSKAEMILKSSRIYKGTHLELPKVSSCQGVRVEADCPEEVLIDMDGEQVGRLPITLDVVPQAIKLIVP